MGMKKKHLLDKRVPVAYSIPRGVKVAFREKCEELGISASRTVENLIKQFLKDLSNGQVYEK